MSDTRISLRPAIDDVFIHGDSMETIFYFLLEDFEALNARILEISNRIRDIGREMGLSCQEGAETFHDNFAYEDGERQQRMWSRRLRELVLIRNQAKVVSPRSLGDQVALGCTVTVRDEKNTMRRLRIGSYMVFSSDDTISYHAPVGRLLIGARHGETREGRIGNEIREFTILSID
jgi:transcription elongation GreA/GreB family factor